MILLKGITGFYTKSEEPPIVDRKQFKQLCFSILQPLGGTVIEFTDSCCQRNFVDAKVTLRDSKFHILLNKHYPMVAFASNVGFASITFRDEPTLLERFRASYRVLSCRELNKPVSLKLGAKKCLLQNENELSQAELEQVAFWKPKTFGEIIFNQWD
jgi:hypothetical protein